MQTYQELIGGLVQQIASDAVNGAEELARRSADVIRTISEFDDSIGAKPLLDRIVEVSRKLIHAKPAMASILHLANTVLGAIDRIDDSRVMRSEITRTIEQWNASSRKSVQAIASHASAMVRNGSVVLTHSFSSTVLATLLSAKQSSRDFGVICSESLPMGEGRRLGQELEKSGIAKRIIADSEIAGAVQRATVVFLGGDAVCDFGVINKVGSREIAAMALRHNVPCHALCSTCKLAPRTFRFSRKEYSEPGITIEGSYDLTPLEVLTAIITENGVCSPGKIKEEIARMRVHQRLL